MIMSIDGQPYGQLEQNVGYADIPTDLNKAYESPLGADGGVSAEQGRYYDPVVVSTEQTGTLDRQKTTPDMIKVGLLIAGALALLYVLPKVIK